MNCVFQTILENVKITKGKEKADINICLRREMLVEFIKNKDVLYPFAKETLRYTYGLVGKQPVSIKEWVKNMSQDQEWGDALCLQLIASWWYVRIGVLRSDCLELITYRNKEGIDDQGFLLLFNFSIVVGHYTPIRGMMQVLCLWVMWKVKWLCMGGWFKGEKE